jgi:ankyrin repeat protein
VGSDRRAHTGIVETICQERDVDTLPVPLHHGVAHFTRRAEHLVQAAQSDDVTAIEQWHTAWKTSLESQLDVGSPDFLRHSIHRALARIVKTVRAWDHATAFTLDDAHVLIAQAHAFESWAAFVEHLAAGADATAPGAVFERAADAVVNGDLDTLAALVRDDPTLVHQRSRREHHVTLLHYVAANGVEDFRQKTPSNAVQITRLLLSAGAEPDATADTYGRDALQTPMNLLVSSVHPSLAGLQSAIAEALLDHGAAANGPADDESPLLTALLFGYIDAAETLVRRGARVDSIVTAAALGQLDQVRAMLVDATTLAPHVALVATPWTTVPREARVHIELALAWACKFARTDVALFLLEQGVSIASMDHQRMTALHWAAANGLIDVVDALLARGAPLELTNAWGGTVLNSTLHFVCYMPVPGVDYVHVLERLLRAGADVGVVDYLAGIEPVDALLARFGAVANG